MKRRILIIDCSENYHEFKQFLLDNNFEIHLAKSFTQGLIKTEREYFDICFLLSNEVNDDITKVIGKIRETASSMAIFFIGNMLTKESVVSIYKAGATDVFNVQVDKDILLIKVLNIVKRLYNVENMKNEFMIGNYFLNYRLRELAHNEKVVKLTPKECELLRMLVDTEDILVSKSHILKLIWKKEDYFTAKSMDVYINRLRKHLLLDKTIVIENIRNSGYRLLIR